MTLRRSSKDTLSPCTPNQKEITEFESLEKVHGRIETRKIKVAEMPAEYLGWNGVCQVFEIERTREIGTKVTKEVVRGITSFAANIASAEKLLLYVRNHWSIENKLHNVRDQSFDEDHCRVRNRCKAQILAAIRNIAIALLRRKGFENIVEGREWCSEVRDRAISMLFWRTE